MEYIKNRFYQKALNCTKEFQRLKTQFSDKVIGQKALALVGALDQILS